MDGEAVGKGRLQRLTASFRTGGGTPQGGEGIRREEGIQPGGG